MPSRTHNRPFPQLRATLTVATISKGNQTMHTLAVVHHKGGVGKTTTTAHLGHALAAGPTTPKVLLIDLDPQASLTRLVGLTPGTGDVGYAAAIDDHDIEAQVVRSDEWGLDVLPAGQRHARIERSSDPGAEQQLRLMLEQASGRWEYVLIDAPGSLGMLTTTALAAAASGVIVPTTPDYLALEPLKTIIQLINTVQAAYQPGCELRGVVINALGEHPRARTSRRPAPASVRRSDPRHHSAPHRPPGHRISRTPAHQESAPGRPQDSRTTTDQIASRLAMLSSPEPRSTTMTTRRNPLDNDLLADLGISTTSAGTDSATGDRAPAATPAAPSRARPWRLARSRPNGSASTSAKRSGSPPRSSPPSEGPPWPT
jgi:chromosome partitioning protein